MDLFNNMKYNWGLDQEKPSIWQIEKTNTYINGIMMIMDNDLDMDLLLHICDNGSIKPYQTYTRHIALHIDDWSEGYMYKFMDHPPYKFFEQSQFLSQKAICSWFLQVIFNGYK